MRPSPDDSATSVARVRPVRPAGAIFALRAGDSAAVTPFGVAAMSEGVASDDVRAVLRCDGRGVVVESRSHANGAWIFERRPGRLTTPRRSLLAMSHAALWSSVMCERDGRRVRRFRDALTGSLSDFVEDDFEVRWLCAGMAPITLHAEAAVIVDDGGGAGGDAMVWIDPPGCTPSQTTRLPQPSPPATLDEVRRARVSAARSLEDLCASLCDRGRVPSAWRVERGRVDAVGEADPRQRWCLPGPHGAVSAVPDWPATRWRYTPLVIRFDDGSNWSVSSAEFDDVHALLVWPLPERGVRPEMDTEVEAKLADVLARGATLGPWNNVGAPPEGSRPRPLAAALDADTLDACVLRRGRAPWSQRDLVDAARAALLAPREGLDRAIRDDKRYKALVVVARVAAMVAPSWRDERGRHLALASDDAVSLRDGAAHEAWFTSERPFPDDVQVAEQVGKMADGVLGRSVRFAREHARAVGVGPEVERRLIAVRAWSERRLPARWSEAAKRALLAALA